MGKIVISTNVSFDGVVQDPDGKEGFRLGGWFGEFGGKDLEEWSKVSFEEALRAEALLLGRRSDEWFAARWLSRSDAWADRLNSMPKYVVSSTLQEPRWSNATVLKGEVVDEVLEAEAGARRGHRRLRQLSARAHADRARPGRRAAAGCLPGRARGRRTPLRRDQRQETHAPRRHHDHRRRPRLRHLRDGPGRLAGVRTAPAFRKARMPARRRAGIRVLCSAGVLTMIVPLSGRRRRTIWRIFRPDSALRGN